MIWGLEVVSIFYWLYWPHELHLILNEQATKFLLQCTLSGIYSQNIAFQKAVVSI